MFVHSEFTYVHSQRKIRWETVIGDQVNEANWRQVRVFATGERGSTCKELGLMLTCIDVERVVRSAGNA